MLQKTSLRLLPWMFLLLGFASAFAQSTAGRMEGTITDSTGAVVPGATVMLIDSETARERQTVSNEMGYYTFALVPPGRYQLLVEKQGFQRSYGAGSNGVAHRLRHGSRVANRI